MIGNWVVIFRLIGMMFVWLNLKCLMVLMLVFSRSCV